MKIFITSILSALIFLACERSREEVQPSELTAQSGKLVVACFISPQDTLLTAKVTRSRPILDSDPLKRVEIADAVVVLSDGSRSVTLAYSPTLRYYQVNANKMPVRAGGTYTLAVRTPDGKQVTAVSTVPMVAALKRAQVDSTVSAELNNIRQKQFSVICTWQSSDAYASFYQVQGGLQGIQRDLPPTASAVSLETIPFKMTDNNSGLLTSSAAGASLSASAYLCDEAGYKAIRSRYRSAAMVVSLLHVSEAYYRYHIALDQQLQASKNPFAEPVLIPGNIQGGLGCFGSYNRSTMTLALK